jgi:hypothetical protein
MPTKDEDDEARVTIFAEAAEKSAAFVETELLRQNLDNITVRGHN